MPRYYSNIAAASTISTVGGISTGSTEVALSTSTGFPSQYPYTLRLDPDTANEELVSVTGPKIGTPGTFLITRAQDGTSAKSHSQGAVVVHGISARDFQEPQNHISATSVGTHGLPDSAWESNFTIYKSVDQSYSNDTTLNDDTVLKFAAAANTKYRVELFLICSGLTPIKVAWSLPAGTGGLRACLGPALSMVDRDDTNMRVSAPQLTTEVPYGLNSTSFFVCIQERFVVSVQGTPGDVILRHAQATSSSDATTVRAASYMVVTKLING